MIPMTPMFPPLLTSSFSLLKVIFIITDVYEIYMTFKLIYVSLVYAISRRCLRTKWS